MNSINPETETMRLQPQKAVAANGVSSLTDRENGNNGVIAMDWAGRSERTQITLSTNQF
jgi:hypothetical protein